MIGEVWGWVVSSVAVVSFLGVAAVFLRGSVTKGTVVSLETTVGALTRENETNKRLWASEGIEKDRKIASQADEIARLTQQLTTLARQVHVLQGVVTSAVEIARLQETLDTHHLEASHHWRELIDLVKELRELMTDA